MEQKDIFYLECRCLTKVILTKGLRKGRHKFWEDHFSTFPLFNFN